jgi:hypothetical protein
MKRLAVVGIVVVLALFAGNIAFFFWNADSIDKATIKTEAMLLLEPFIEPKEIVEWLEQYHGEGPDQGVMAAFASWSVRNRETATPILNRLSPSVLDRVAWALRDVQLTNQFIEVYSGVRSEGAAKVIAKLQAMADGDRS